MLMISLAVVLAIGMISIGIMKDPSPSMSEKSIYDFTMKTIDGEDRPLSAYKGKVLMIVNVASKCGYTPQYEDLQRLYETYHEKGFEILGFPANNFLWQEPGTDEDIKQFCSLEYGVTFDMFSKISVKGKDQHPLYTFITNDPAVEGSVKWNFQKYLVSRKGELVAKYMSAMEPMDQEVTTKIEALLADTE